MVLLLLYVLLALAFSFLCSILEAVLLSVTPAYIAAKAEAGEKTATILQKLKADIDRPLAAILSLNTIAHTVGAAGAGAQAMVVFESVSVGVVSGMLTLLILVLSEIIPKTLGAAYWRSLAPLVARLLRPLIWLLYPFVLLSMGITRLIGGTHEQRVSREELSAMAELGRQQGVFEARESTILRNVFRFNHLTVEHVMTPRLVVFSLPEDRAVSEVTGVPFSRFPVYTGTPDHVTGYVLRSDVLTAQAQDQPGTLRDLRRDVLHVAEHTPLPDLFDQLLDRREHLAVVVGQYGDLVGVATMEDVVETMLGLEIVDESDRATDMQQHAREKWLERARKLGYWNESDLETLSEERKAAVQYGLTGGEPPT